MQRYITWRGSTVRCLLGTGNTDDPGHRGETLVYTITTDNSLIKGHGAWKKNTITVVILFVTMVLFSVLT